jgi:hypothetical protein
MRNTPPAGFQKKTPRGRAGCTLCHDPVCFMTGGRHAVSVQTSVLARNSFSAIALGPRFYARTSLSMTLRLFFAFGTHTAHWFILSTARCQKLALALHHFCAARRREQEAVPSAFSAEPGQTFNVRAYTVSPFTPCQSVARRRHVSLGTFLYVYPSSIASSHLISDSMAMSGYECERAASSHVEMK